MLGRLGCRFSVRLASSAPLLSYSSFTPSPSTRALHVSSTLLKVAKGKDKLKKAASNVRAAAESDNEFLQEALREMKEIETALISHLATQTSLQVDLRPYESLIVKLEDKTEDRLGKLARVSLKGARTVVINVSERPSTIKAIKNALQNSALTSSVNVQQEGVVLYVATPLMTRERREKMAEEASGTLLNDYKKKVNEVYVRVQKKASAASKNEDEGKKTTKDLLAFKRSMEEKGAQAVKEAKKKLLMEVV